MSERAVLSTLSEANEQSGLYIRYTVRAFSCTSLMAALVRPFGAAAKHSGSCSDANSMQGHVFVNMTGQNL